MKVIDLSGHDARFMAAPGRDGRKPCRLLQVSGGIGDAIVAASKARSLPRDGVRTVAVVIPNDLSSEDTAVHAMRLFPWVSVYAADQICSDLREIQIWDDRSSESYAGAINAEWRVKQFFNFKWNLLNDIPLKSARLTDRDISMASDLPDLPSEYICIQPSSNDPGRIGKYWIRYPEAVTIFREAGIPTVLIGGKSDMQRVEQFPSEAINLVGKLSLSQSITTVLKSSGCIAANSWSAICAAAFGLPSICLRGESFLAGFETFILDVGGTLMDYDEGPRAISEAMMERIR